MLTQFSKTYFLAHRGCYSREKMEQLVDSNKHETIFDFLEWDISIKDKMYFIRNYCELSLKEKLILSLVCAKVSVAIYELKYPKDSRIRDCVNAIDAFNSGDITKDELMTFRHAAAYAAYAAAADAADADAADAVAYAAAADAAAYAADAAAAYAAYAAAADAADAVAYAADAGKSDRIHTNNLLNALKQFFTDHATL